MRHQRAMPHIRPGLWADASRGTITCLDAGNYGVGLQIFQSIMIDCTGTFGGVQHLSPPPPFPSIDIFAGANDVVELRGLTFRGAGTALAVRVGQVGILRVQDCKITGYTNSGIEFTAPDGVGSELYVSDTSISEVAPLPMGVVESPS
jgi:hypothetical protein